MRRYRSHSLIPWHMFKHTVVAPLASCARRTLLSLATTNVQIVQPNGSFIKHDLVAGLIQPLSLSRHTFVIVKWDSHGLLPWRTQVPNSRVRSPVATLVISHLSVDGCLPPRINMPRRFHSYYGELSLSMWVLAYSLAVYLATVWDQRIFRL